MTQCPKCAAILPRNVRACSVCKTRRTFERHWNTDVIRTMALSVDRCIRRGFRYSGRASGYEFWYFWTLAVFFGTAVVRTLGHSQLDHVVAALLLVPMLLAASSVTVRRLHDAGKGALMLVVPPICALVLWHFEVSMIPHLERRMSHVLITSVEISLITALAVTLLRTMYFLAKNSDSNANRYGRRDPIP